MADVPVDEGARIAEDKLGMLNRTVDLGQGRKLKPVDDEEGGFALHKNPYFFIMGHQCRRN